MPSDPRISESDRPGREKSGGIKGVAEAEKLMQIAFVLPCAMLLGWGAGWGVDRWLHSHWAAVVGLVLGLAAGMVSVIRTAMGAMKSLGEGK